MTAGRLAARIEEVVSAAARALSGPDTVAAIDADQARAYDLAMLASDAAALRALEAGLRGETPGPATSRLAVGLLVRDAHGRLARIGVSPPPDDEWKQACELADEPTAVAAIGEAPDMAAIGLDDETRVLAAELRRFGESEIAPLAGDIHREDRDVPEEIIRGLGGMGVFGLSVPEEHGGSRAAAGGDHLPMVLATEVLSSYSLAAAGSLITRPEILTAALLAGGTEEQKQRWLPGIASGELMVAVAVTEPDAGSDVAAVRLDARRVAGGYSLTGTKTWSTFAGRAELLMVLARTDPDRGSGHRGLSLFVVEKPPRAGTSFTITQEQGRSLAGTAIPTIGYRGMHSFELRFDGWLVPEGALIGGERGLGRGFYLQMGAFAAGRLQTAARAVGIMQSAFDLAAGHAEERRVFGRRLSDYGLTRHRLAGLVARLAVARLFVRRVAAYLDSGDGQLHAAMVKALACRYAEEATRDAMQLFGGYGYAEESDVARLYVDARVLSIFEGTEEVLALRVIARSLAEQASAPETASD